VIIAIKPQKTRPATDTPVFVVPRIRRLAALAAAKCWARHVTQ
jgi:hypothetical protein